MTSSQYLPGQWFVIVEWRQLRRMRIGLVTKRTSSIFNSLSFTMKEPLPPLTKSPVNAATQAARRLRMDP